MLPTMWSGFELLAEREKGGIGGREGRTTKKDTEKGRYEEKEEKHHTLYP
jgi:hypothetical protein